MIRTIHVLAFAAFLAIPLAGSAQTIEVKKDAPARYVVQPGDTLWHISGRYLSQPWLWPKVWEDNPQVKNPHLIYPGDELLLVYHEGRARVRLRRGRHPTIKLSPQVRMSALDAAVPVIPVDVIDQFLRRPRVVARATLEEAPYIVSVGKESMIARAGQKIFARGMPSDERVRYAVYRSGQEFYDPVSKDFLGLEAVHVGDAVLIAGGDPTTLVLTRAEREVLNGDRLLPVVEDDVDAHFFPRAPDSEVDGQIMAVFDGVTQIGQYQIVVLNLGTDHGIAAGHVMSVYQEMGDVIDPRGTRTSDIAYTPKPARIELDREKQDGLDGFGRSANDAVYAIHQNIRGFVRQFDRSPKPWTKVELPDEWAGTVMVFRPFQRLSYALVMDAVRAMHINDTVRKPVDQIFQ